mgnify:CR=1 FL=1
MAIVGGARCLPFSIFGWEGGTWLKGIFCVNEGSVSDVYFGVEVLQLVNLVWKYRKKFMRPQWVKQLRVATS